MQDLVLEQGSYLEINTRVLKHLQAVITEWPGGEPKPLPAFHIPTQVLMGKFQMQYEISSEIDKQSFTFLG